MVLVTLTASIGFNSLGVANDLWYGSVTASDDQLVLDAILRSQQIHRLSPLGKYSRPTMDPADSSARAYALFNSGNTDGEFNIYRSQFGLQGLIFYALFNQLHIPIDVIVHANALASVVVLSGIYLVLLYEFGALAGACAALTFALSPWVVLFAQSLFWVPWTWFLPILLSLLFGRRLFVSATGAAAAGLVIFFALLLRFLCGYDYMTTLVLCCLAPIVYYGLKSGRPASLVVRRISVVGLAACLAFAGAVSLQSLRIGSNFSDGLRTVWMSAQKRTMSISSEEQGLTEFGCGGISADVGDCKDAIATSLNSSAPGVLMMYMAFRNFLPWLNGPEYDLDHAAASNLKKVASSGHFAELIPVVERLDRRQLVGALLMVVQSLCGIALLVITSILLVKDGRRGLPFAGLISASLMGAVSWFILAKAHSQVHTHLNYVLWNIGFVPFSVLYLVWRKQRVDIGFFDRRLTTPSK
jgi:hypothetical protein